MTPSLGLVANMYQEARALPGWLEMASCGMFDDVCVHHTGPGGAYSTDGTIEMLEAWGARIVYGEAGALSVVPSERPVRVVYGSIDAGFGAVRTQTVRNSNCEWVMLLDADERFHELAPVLRCSPDCTVVMDGEPYNQGAWVKAMLGRQDIDAICTMRRHWRDFSWYHPDQSWLEHPDYQLRIVRNVPEVHYTTETRMHEHLTDDRTGQNPRFRKPEPPHGPYFDHYHLAFKALEMEQRRYDIAVYDALHFQQPIPTQEEFAARQAVAK
jgi:hypothetical protein